MRQTLEHEAKEIDGGAGRGLKRDLHDASVDGGSLVVAIDVLTTDHVEDDIGAAASGRLFGGGDEVLGLVVDGEIGTERDACRTFFRRSGCRDDTGAERLGELVRGRADAGRPAVDQQCFSGSKATALENVVPDREEGFGDGRRLDQRQILWDRQRGTLAGETVSGGTRAGDQ